MTLHTKHPAEVHHLTQMQKLKIRDSERRSIGYETMTTVSDVDSEVGTHFSRPKTNSHLGFNSMYYRSGTVNSNTVNSKFHLIRNYCEIFFYNFPNIPCLKYTVNSNFHLIRS